MGEMKRSEKELRDRGQRLAQLMKFRGIKSQEELANKLDCTQVIISRLINGTLETSAFIIPLCKELQCDVFWFDEGTGNAPWEINPGIGKIPLVPWHQIPSLSMENLNEWASKYAEFIDLSFKNEKDIYASYIPDTIVPGNSNYYFKPRDLLLISPKREPNPSKFVIAHEESWYAPLFLQYWIRGNTPYLIHNETEIPFTKKTKICGVVVARINIFI